MKRRFINDEQHPFPEGRACGVVLDALYHSAEAANGMLQAKALAVAAAIAGFTSFIAGESYMKLIQEKWLGFSSSWHLPRQPRRLVLLRSSRRASRRCRSSRAWTSASSRCRRRSTSR